MFQIPDDLNFDDEFLDSEFNPDLSKPSEDGPLANVKKIPAESSINSPTHLKINCNNPKPSLVASSHGRTSFVPKLNKSVVVQEGRCATVAGFTGHCADINQPVARSSHSPQDKSYVQNCVRESPTGYSSATGGNPQQTHQRSSRNRSLGRGGRSPPTITSTPVSLIPAIKSNLLDATEPQPETSGNLSSSHSEFLAKWNDNNFFHPEPKEGPPGRLRPSSATHPNQQPTAEAVTRKITKTVRQRRFPGPAGLLPPRQGSTSLIAPEEFLNELKSEENDPSYEETDILSQSSGSVFEGGAWSAMLEDLGSQGQSLLKTMNLASVKSIGRNLRSYKVPFLAVLVQSVDASLPDATVGFKDPTDEMHGVVHRDVWDQFGSDIAVGTVLVLRTVGIMSAGISSRQHVINITGRNLTAIYSPKDELNIQLRQIHEFAASSSTKLLDEWEKVASQMHSASPISSRIKKPPLNMSPFNNNLGIRPRHAMSTGQPLFTPSPRGNPRSQRFNSTMYNNSNSSRFNLSSPNVSTGAQSALNPFMAMPSRHGNGHSPPGNVGVNRQSPMMQKSPSFTIKTPSNSAVLPGSSHHTVPPSAPNIDRYQQQPPPRRHQTTSESTIPTKKPKVCQNVAPNSSNVTKKSNPFQVLDTSAVDSLLEGIDTDSLFGDF